MNAPHIINYYYYNDNEIIKVVSVRDTVPNEKALTGLIPAIQFSTFA